jgi:hypothetical protein
LYEFVNGSPLLIGSYSANTTTAPVNNLVADTRYAFDLVAMNSTTSAATTWIGVATDALTPLVAPANFTGAALSASQIQFTWTPSTGATEYLLYAFLGNQLVLVGTYGAGTASATVSDLASGTYAFNLVALSGTQNAATPWIAANTVNGVLMAPTGFAGSPLSSSQVTLNWAADPNATGYALYEYENNQPVLIQTLNAGTTTMVVGNLSPNTHYAFNLVAFSTEASAATQWIGVSTIV